MNIVSWFGVTMTFVLFRFLLFVIFRRVCFGDPVAGWAFTICVIVFIGGIQLFCMGIMGQYIAKTYTESKHRPRYIILSTNKDGIERIG